nr:B3 domain-containing protein REM17-like isoform X2 [Ipomoea batatas]
MANGLKEGDAYKFELIKTGEKPIAKLSWHGSIARLLVLPLAQQTFQTFGMFAMSDRHDTTSSSSAEQSSISFATIKRVTAQKVVPSVSSAGVFKANGLLAEGNTRRFEFKRRTRRDVANSSWGKVGKHATLCGVGPAIFRCSSLKKEMHTSLS